MILMENCINSPEFFQVCTHASLSHFGNLYWVEIQGKMFNVRVTIQGVPSGTLNFANQFHCFNYYHRYSYCMSLSFQCYSPVKIFKDSSITNPKCQYCPYFLYQVSSPLSPVPLFSPLLSSISDIPSKYQNLSPPKTQHQHQHPHHQLGISNLLLKEPLSQSKSKPERMMADREMYNWTILLLFSILFSDPSPESPLLKSSRGSPQFHTPLPSFLHSTLTPVPPLLSSLATAIKPPFHTPLLTMNLRAFSCTTASAGSIAPPVRLCSGGCCSPASSGPPPGPELGHPTRSLALSRQGHKQAQSDGEPPLSFGSGKWEM